MLISSPWWWWFKGKGEYYHEKEVIFSVWPSGKVIKTEEEHGDIIETGILIILFYSFGSHLGKTVLIIDEL